MFPGLLPCLALLAVVTVVVVVPTLLVGLAAALLASTFFVYRRVRSRGRYR